MRGSVGMAELNLQFSWVVEFEGLESLASFFVNNVDPSYISHGEIIAGRSHDGVTWSTDLHAIMLKELLECVASFRNNRESRAATVKQHGKLLGLAIVQVVHDDVRSHAWIDDMVIDRDVRSRRVGGQFLTWLEAEITGTGIASVFIESGVGNVSAHHFFQRRGYATCSLVMKKML